MSSNHVERLTSNQSGFILVTDNNQPNVGTRCLALTFSSKLIELVWNRDAPRYCVAYAPYPKIPDEVKQKISQAYTSGYSSFLR